MNCAKCSASLSENGDFVTCAVCCNKYDYNCSVRETRWRNMTADIRSKWACATCKETTSVSRATSVSSNVSDVAAMEEEDVSVKALLLRMNSRLDKLDDLKVSVDTMSKSLSFLSDRYDELLEEVRGYRQANAALKKDVEILKSECQGKDRAYNELNRRFNSLEQYGRAVNLEVHGLEQELPDEVPDLVLEKVAAALQQSYNPSDIQAAHRLPTRSKDRPPIFLVQFVNKAMKERWLAAGRRKKLYSKDIVGKGEQRVFFNENLTPHYSGLFRDARLKARSRGYESAWVMHGSIRVRKSRDVRAIVISDYEDLKHIV